MLACYDCMREGPSKLLGGLGHAFRGSQDVVLVIHCSQPLEHALISYVQHPSRSHGRIAVAILHCKRPGASS